MATGPRECAACGEAFTPPPKGSKARFCSLACRVAAAKSRRHGVPEARPDLRALRGGVEVEDQAPDELLSLEDLARTIAAKLASPNTPPTAIAGLAREYRATFAEVEKRRPAEVDPLERLRLVVAEKIGGA